MIYKIKAGDLSEISIDVEKEQAIYMRKNGYSLTSSDRFWTGYVWGMFIAVILILIGASIFH